MAGAAGSFRAVIWVHRSKQLDRGLAITKTLAKEFAARKIRVTGVNPGFVVTEGTNSAGMVGGEFEAWALANTPLGRVGRPEDIAAAVAFLASDDASWITGESLVVSGGNGMSFSTLSAFAL